MSNQQKSPKQLPLLPDIPSFDNEKKLKLDPEVWASIPQNQDQIIDVIPEIILPTRWEKLEPRISKNDASLHSIIRPVHQAITVVRDINDYLQATDGFQVLVIRAHTGSGKTTFLNTLPHYINDIELNTQTIDIQRSTAEEFASELWQTTVSQTAINLIILEG